MNKANAARNQEAGRAHARRTRRRKGLGGMTSGELVHRAIGNNLMSLYRRQAGNAGKEVHRTASDQQ